MLSFFTTQSQLVITVNADAYHDPNSPISVIGVRLNSMM